MQQFPPPIERRSHLSWEIRARVGRPRGNGGRCEIVGFSRGARSLFVAIVCRTAGVRSPVRRSETDRQPVYDLQRAHARARAYAGARPSYTRCPETVRAEKIAFQKMYGLSEAKLVNSVKHCKFRGLTGLVLLTRNRLILSNKKQRKLLELYVLVLKFRNLYEMKLIISKKLVYIFFFIYLNVSTIYSIIIDKKSCVILRDKR